MTCAALSRVRQDPESEPGGDCREQASGCRADDGQADAGADDAEEAQQQRARPPIVKGSYVCGTGTEWCAAGQAQAWTPSPAPAHSGRERATAVETRVSGPTGPGASMPAQRISRGYAAQSGGFRAAPAASRCVISIWRKRCLRQMTGTQIDAIASAMPDYPLDDAFARSLPVELGSIFASWSPGRPELRDVNW